MPGSAKVFAPLAMWSIETGSPDDMPTAMLRSRAAISRRPSAWSISLAVGTASMVTSALAKGRLLAPAMRPARLRGLAPWSTKISPRLGVARRRREGLRGGGEASAHGAGDAEITLKSAHQPIQPVEVLLRRQRGEQRLL